MTHLPLAAAGLATLVATALGAALLCRALLHPRLGPRILDRPGERSLHVRPTPRTGGIAIFGAVAVGLLLGRALGVPLSLPPAVLAGTLLLMAISLLDDLRGLTAAMRLPVHGVAALVLLGGGLAPGHLALPGGAVLPLGWAGAVPAWLYVVWMTNLYNFMDGMDGFAGGMGAWGFGTLGLIALDAGHGGYAFTALVLAAANLGFLTANFPPARLFMGDMGAVPMGFLAAALALAGTEAGLFPLWVPVLAFSPFIVDATVTLLRRLLRGERVWVAHRSHYYQRLVLLGWGHRKTTLAGYAIMAACGATAFGVARHPTPAVEVAAALIWCAVYATLAQTIAWLERRKATGDTSDPVQGP